MATTHEPLAPMMALRLKNDGFGPCTGMFEAYTLEEVLESYTRHCYEYGEVGTINGWLEIQFIVEGIGRERAGDKRAERGRVLAGIGNRCSIILQTPQGTVEYDPDGEASKCEGLVPAPHARYLTSDAEDPETLAAAETRPCETSREEEDEWAREPAG